MGAGSHSKTSVKSNNHPQIDHGPLVPCEPCQEQGQGLVRDATSFCVQCRQVCCQTCAENHRKFKGTQAHQHALFMSGNGARRLNTHHFPCDQCRVSSNLDKHTASVLCTDCKQLFCNRCQSVHDDDATLKPHKKRELAAHARTHVSDGNDFGRREEKASVKSELKGQFRRDARDNGQHDVKYKTATKSSHSIAAIHRGEFTATIKADKYTANIYDVSTMVDGKIIVIDDRNSKMKIFTPDYKLHAVLSFAYLPGNVTCINENMIAMAVGNEVLYFKIKDTKITQMAHKLALKGEITGIVKNVNTLAVTYEMYGSKSRIGIIKSNGSEKELNKTEHNSATATERWGRIAITKNSHDASLNVVVLEDDSGKLGCYDNEGQRLWTCLIPQAGSWQGGMCTKMGGIAAVADVFLVTDVINHVIHVVTEFGEYGGILDKADRLHRPYAVCFNNTSRLLYVTQFRSDVVKVLSIK
ncbi:uncharacterized protein [Argopecten irradians]|uniref:uncharacterized protein n=1 Tax=Argopecten irradians TaxID=31199 RepID=UPI003721C1BC